MFSVLSGLLLVMTVSFHMVNCISLVEVDTLILGPFCVVEAVLLVRTPLKYFLHHMKIRREGHL